MLFRSLNWLVNQPLRRSWHFRSGPRTVTDPAPMTGLCAYALAFSTLLSSQGADAHRHKAFAWIEGNPLSLPARSSAVKRFRKTLTASQPLWTSTLPCRRHSYVRTARNRGLSWLAPRTDAPAGDPVRAWGQDETLGTHASYVKSSEREPRPRRSADAESLSPGSHARIIGSGSPAPGQRA